MKKNNPLFYPIPRLFILLISVSILIFLDACSGEISVGSSEMHIYVEGTVTDISNGSLAENVEIQLYSISTGSGTRSIKRTTATGQDGKYSISYYGKCSLQEVATTLKVRVNPPAGYKYITPSSYIIQCTTKTQTFNFQIEPLL